MDSLSVDSNNNAIDESNAKTESTNGSFEERVKVDRKKFEQIINGENKELGPAEEFFNEIMAETNTVITWPTKLKPGTKSKKDPHIRITGAQEDILSAKDKILDHLDSRKNRVTLKMDVAYTDHSHIIGKGGRSIQKVMNETGCHIHFPDSNRTNTIDKSNQVSIAGTALGAEQARCRIRELLPLSVHFELPIAGYNKMEMFDHTSPAMQTIQQTYGISINIRIVGKGNVFGNFGSSCASYASISVRGTRAQWLAMKQGIAVLIEYLCGHQMANNPASPTIFFTLVIDIASQHHSFVMGRGNVNIRSIMQSTGVVINFPDPAAVENSTMTTLHGSLTVRKSTVMIKGPCFDSVVLAWQELLGYLPLVLIFDLKEGQQTDAALITQLMKDYEVTILIKQKPKQNSGRCMTVRGAERDSRMLFEVRRQILELDESEVPNCCDKHTIMMMAKLFSSFLPQCTFNPASMMTMKNGFGSNINPSGCLPNSSGLGGQVNGLLNWPSNDYSNLNNFPGFAAAAAAAAASTATPSPLGPNGFLQAMLASQLTNFAAAAAASQQQPQISTQPNTPSFNIDMLKNNSDNRNGNGCVQSVHNMMATSTTPTMNQSCLTNSSMNSPNSGSETSAPSPLDLSPPPNRSLSAIFGNFSVSDKSTAFPWPEPRKLDYDERKYLATKAVREAKPKASEPRTPTPSWAGFGFSKSMPHELLKSRLDSCRATEKLTPVEESPDELNNPNSLLTNGSLSNDLNLQSSFWEPTKYPPTNGIKTLRKQQSFDFSSCSGSLSLGSSMSSSSSLFSNSSSGSSNLFDPISSSTRSKSGSISSGYGSPTSSLDLAEVLTRLGLAKYIDYFQRADIDFNTFLNFNDADLEELGIPYFGRRKLSSAILDCKRALREQGSISPFNHFEAAPGAERSRKVKNIV